jgi:PAS domain S-box-containing protein
MTISNRIGISLRWKLAALMTAVVAVVALLLLVSFRQRLQEDALRSARASARELAEISAHAVSPALLFEDRVEAREALDGACRSRIVEAVTVRYADGRLFTRCSALAAVRGPIDSSTVPIVSEGMTIGSLRLDISLAPVYDHLDSSRRWLMGLIAVAFGCGVLGVSVVSVWVTRPLQRITQTAEAVREGDTAIRTKVDSADEIGVLAHTFNRMLDELETSRGELESLNRGLEYTVERRTREITLLLQSTYDGILAADENLNCVMVNRAAAATLLLETGEIIGRNLHEVVHPDCRDHECGIRALLAAGRRGHVKERFSREGLSVSAYVAVAPILDGKTQVGMVMTIRDVTEQEQLQEELEKTRRLSSMGSLAATMAHEFNNVLMGILPFAELTRRAAANPAVTRYCDTIERSVQRGKRVAQEVLRFTRPQQPNRRHVGLAEWLDEFGPTLRATLGTGIIFEVRVHDRSLAVDADREQIEQVLVNLTTNARDAMPKGGFVDLDVAGEGNLVRISFRDSGSGMSPDTLQRVWEPFFTTKALGGTGLGLPIARQIIEAHGGTMTIDTVLGEGTRIDLRLPLARNAVPETVPVIERRAGKASTLLMVEDDPAVAEGVRAMLGDLGITVDLAPTGIDALRLLGGTRRYDGVILDVGLPDCDGVTLFNEIARRQPRLPVVFSTGHADEAALAGALDRRNVRFIRKPYPVEDLLDLFADIAREVEPGRTRA